MSIKLEIDDDLWIAMMINSSLERFNGIQSLRSAGSHIYDKVFVIIAGMPTRTALYKLRFMHELYDRDKTVLLKALRYAINRYAKYDAIINYLLIRISLMDRRPYNYVRGVYMTHRQSDCATLPLPKAIAGVIESYKLQRLVAIGCA